ncbi:MAG: non-ribosomal peptide synthetase, partial [Caldilineaceae bacterium]|nr:non-ribosomal peptide synthetase [Caldilineaceae bacterium]
MKLRGFRIELGEIEAAMRGHPSVQNSLVRLVDDDKVGKRLIAWWINRHAMTTDSAEFRSFLRARLSEYMLPAHFVNVDSFPLNGNGKIDERKLPLPNPNVPTALGQSPQTSLERHLLSIWQQVLGARNIGLDDNFFDAGGHSLLAVRLMARVSAATGQELPVASLFYSPTIRQQANLVEQQGWASPWTSLVPVHSGGTRPPLFLVPPAAATSVRLAQLSRFLGPDQPVYSFDPPGFDGRNAPLDTVQAISRHYVNELRLIQPSGPYLLGGMC